MTTQTSSRQYRVLVADDNKNILNDIVKGLTTSYGYGHGSEDYVAETAKYVVDTAESGAIALDFINIRDYDLAFFSASLFDMNGLLLTQIARGQGKEFRIIIVCDHANLETAIDALSMGANDFVIQPFEDLKAIEDVAYRAMEKQRLEEEKERLLVELQASNRALEIAKQEIEVWNHELEKKVSERTHELERSRYKIQEYADQLERKNEELKKLDAMKTDFLANISHELKTPLTAILGYSEIFIMGDENSISPQFKEFAMMINDSGKQLLTLITDLLYFSEIERGVMELTLQAIHVNDIIESALYEIEEKAKKKQIEITFNRRDDLPPVTADPQKVGLALLKVLDNAVKFTPEGGKVTITNSQKMSYILTSVQDTGVGIAEDQIGVVFERLRQGDGSSTREFGGLGMGLSMARQLIEMHNGTIFVESELEKGSCFTFSLPISDEKNEDFDYPY